MFETSVCETQTSRRHRPTDERPRTSRAVQSRKDENLPSCAIPQRNLNRTRQPHKQHVCLRGSLRCKVQVAHAGGDWTMNIRYHEDLKPSCTSGNSFLSESADWQNLHETQQLTWHDAKNHVRILWCRLHTFAVQHVWNLHRRNHKGSLHLCLRTRV